MSKQTPPSFPRYQRLAGSLGERLRIARLRRRMSATEMAERMGVSRMTLHSLEAHERMASQFRKSPSGALLKSSQVDFMSTKCTKRSLR